MKRWLIAGLIALCWMIVPAVAQKVGPETGGQGAVAVTVGLNDRGGTIYHGSTKFDALLYPLDDDAGVATVCPAGVNGWCYQSFSTGPMATFPTGSFSDGTWRAVYRDASGEEVTATSTDFNGTMVYDSDEYFTFTASFTATDSLGRTCSGGIDRLVTRRYIYRGYTYLMAPGTTWLTCE